MTQIVNKKQLVADIVEQTNLPKANVLAVLDCLNDTVVSHARNGLTVYWRNFFTAKAVILKERTYHTPFGKTTHGERPRLHVKASATALLRNVI